MATTIFGGTTIQPLEVNFSASQQVTTLVFLSNNSGSYIYGGSDPLLGPNTGSITFEDNGSIYSFIFSGSGYTPPTSSLPGTTISASIDGLTNSGSIANIFSSSVGSVTNMDILIVTDSILFLKNSAFSSSSFTTSSFSNNTLSVNNAQKGHPAGFLSGSDTTGSLVVTGSVNITGSFTLNNKLVTGITTGYIVIPSASVLQANATPILLDLNIPAGSTPNIINAFQFVATGGTPYATNLSSSLRSSGSADDLFIATSLDDTAGNEYRFLPQSTYNAISGRDLVWTVLDGETVNGNRDVTVIVSYFLV